MAESLSTGSLSVTLADFTSLGTVCADSCEELFYLSVTFTEDSEKLKAVFLEMPSNNVSGVDNVCQTVSCYQEEFVLLFTEQQLAALQLQLLGQWDAALSLLLHDKEWREAAHRLQPPTIVPGLGGGYDLWRSGYPKVCTLGFYCLAAAGPWPSVSLPSLAWSLSGHSVEAFKFPHCLLSLGSPATLCCLPLSPLSLPLHVSLCCTAKQCWNVLPQEDCGIDFHGPPPPSSPASDTEVRQKVSLHLYTMMVSGCLNDD